MPFSNIKDDGSDNKTHEDSEFIEHIPCENCGSSDANSLYTDGHQFCFSCNHFVPATDRGTGSSSSTTVLNNTKAPKDFLDVKALGGQFYDLPSRKLRAETLRKFGYYVVPDYHGKPCQVACTYDELGNVIMQKIRFPNKEFLTRVKTKGSLPLFGMHLWQSGKKIVITEGEVDAMTVSEIQGNKYPVVSLPNGAQGAHKAIKANLDKLLQFDEIILMFDMDEAGRKAVEECVSLFPPSRVKIAQLPLKDASDMHKEGRDSEIIQAIWNAREYRPDGIVAGTDLYEQLVESVLIEEGIPYPWADLNNNTYGIRQGELVTITSGSGMGKSTLTRELEYYLGVTLNQRVGILALEESTKKTGMELMSIHANDRIALHPTDFTKDKRKDLYEGTLGNGNFYLYDHFGSTDGDNLIDKIRFMVVSLGCKFIFLDHISIVVSGMDDGDERRTIDRLMTRLRSLVEETQCSMFVISHLKRPPDKKGHEEGAVTSLSQLRGSHAIGQLSDLVLGLERNQQGNNPNVSIVRILKNRFCGDTGTACCLEYNKHTGRMHSLPLSAIDFDEEADGSEEFR